MTSVLQALDALSEILLSRNSVAPVEANVRVRFFSRSQKENLDILKSMPWGLKKLEHGFLVAEQFLDAARTLEDTDFDAALFRAFHYFRHLALENRVPRQQRVVAAYASLHISRFLQNPPELMVEDVREIALGAEEIVEDTWISTLGMSASQFQTYLGIINEAIHSKRVDAKPSRAALVVPDDRKPTESRFAMQEGRYVESYLELGSANRELWNWSSLGAAFKVQSTAHDESNEELLAQIVKCLVGRSFSQAGQRASALLGRVGESWSPSPTVEGRNAVRVIQAAWHLRDFESGLAGSRRLASLSAYELLQGLELFESLCEELWEGALDGLSPLNPASNQEWLTTVVRLAVASEWQIGRLNSDETSYLTTGWKDRIGDSSRLMTSEIIQQAQRMRRVVQGTQEVPLRESRRELARLIHEIRPIAFESELLALKSLAEVAQDISSAYFGKREDPAKLGHLLELEDAFIGILEKCVNSLSALVQEVSMSVLGPMYEVLNQAKGEAAESARPEVSIKLLSDRLPLSHGDTNQRELVLDFELENQGNGVAKAVLLELSGSAIQSPVRHNIDRTMLPGERLRIQLSVVLTGKITQLDLAVALEWKSDLFQKYSLVKDFVAEAERPSRWQVGDVNPYSTDAVRSRRQLFGRDQQLNELRTQLIAGVSVVITGHKRVGKSSLATVACSEILSDQCVASITRLAYLQVDSARSLIRSLIDYLSHEISSQVPSIDYVEFNPSDDRVSQMAGRWMGTTKKTLENMGEIKVVVVIDDFDELPKDLLEGAESDELFRFIRAASEEPWLSIVFVGSEVMPAMLSRHSARMNLFTSMSVDRIESIEEMSQLIVSPSNNRLEWSGEAVVALAKYVDGNPYFAVLLCRELWQQLRERERSYATERDVIQCAYSFAKSADRRHFVHLWGDSEDGMSAESEIADLNIYVLYAIAKLSGESGSCRQDEVVDWVQSRIAETSRSSIQTRIRDLVTRGVVAQLDGDLVRIRISLVNLWFIRGADENLSDRLRGLAFSRGSQFTASDVLELADNFSFGGREITDTQIQAWLEQFSEPAMRAASFKMLKVVKDIGYFSAERVERLGAEFRDKLDQSPLVKKIAKSPNGRSTTNVLVVPIFDCDTQIASRFAVGAKVPKSAVRVFEDVVLDDLHNEVTVFLFFASFDGTKSEVIRSLSSAIRVLVEKGVDFEVLVVSLTSLSTDTELIIDERRISRFALSLIDHRCIPKKGLDTGESEIVQDGVAFDRLLRQQRELLRDEMGGWGDYGLLIAFDGALPTYAPAIFWKTGSYQRKDWRPLFHSVSPWEGEREVTSGGYLGRLISLGETAEVEFKESLRTPAPVQGESIQKSSPGKGKLASKEVLEHSVIRAVASMLNNETGGQVLIGVRNDKSIAGLSPDFFSIKDPSKQNEDGFELALRELLSNKIVGLQPNEVETRYEIVEGKIICVLNCPAAPEPRWVTVSESSGQRKALYVRDGARTKELVGPAIVDFVNRRFPRK